MFLKYRIFIYIRKQNEDWVSAWANFFCWITKYCSSVEKTKEWVFFKFKGVWFSSVHYYPSPKEIISEIVLKLLDFTPVKLAYEPSFIDRHFYSEAEITFTGKGSTVHRIRGAGLSLGYVGGAHSLLFTLLWYVSKHPIATPVVWEVSSKIMWQPHQYC